MFTVEARMRLQESLLAEARADERITGAAITGSGALDNTDRWSDIDLAFGVREASELPNVLSDFTNRMYEKHFALHHLDVTAGTWLYRVFLLPDTLQVDLGFAPAPEFRALAPSFKLVFGETREPRQVTSRPAHDVIGWGWLYALHARSSLARRKHWQAEYMISGLRDSALALACLRHGLATAHARGVDELPNAVAAQFEGALVRRLEGDELYRAFGVAVQGLLSEIHSADAELARRLQNPLTSLAEA
jgi:hypothetical protein